LGLIQSGRSTALRMRSVTRRLSATPRPQFAPTTSAPAAAIPRAAAPGCVPIIVRSWSRPESKDHRRHHHHRSPSPRRSPGRPRRDPRRSPARPSTPASARMRACSPYTSRSSASVICPRPRRLARRPSDANTRARSPAARRAAATPPRLMARPRLQAVAGEHDPIGAEGLVSTISQPAST
jgi:hypothetical protein